MEKLLRLSIGSKQYGQIFFIALAAEGNYEPLIRIVAKRIGQSGELTDCCAKIFWHPNAGRAAR